MGSDCAMHEVSSQQAQEFGGLERGRFYRYLKITWVCRVWFLQDDELCPILVVCARDAQARKAKQEERQKQPELLMAHPAPC
eukprot:155061-Rhodomonas_salina.3